MQPPISDTFTIRQADGNTSVEISTPTALIIATSDALTVMTRHDLHTVSWADLIEILADLAAQYSPDARMQPIPVFTAREIAAANRAALARPLIPI